ncbi:DUF2147 domain-containing protein [Bradyrhizobium sp. NP1]|uniref:DUF2147 domain-containing protein n=1 Tax=Bradyrhizobium sp. NP1 TaxID=3049772 RepID=UPI0025A5A1A7|nr:DUF2147 domain-containing protein [Bradyrhizobium sp. NP1]WJR77038.1 DUF2147 domain-containing protein [Bradyrhizobium sp. NP1]
MRKLTLIAAMLMASTAAHAGNAVSIEIDGHKIRIEAPRHCDAISCLKISGINLNGIKFGNSSKDDDDDASLPPPQAATVPAPVPQASAPVVTAAPPVPTPNPAIASPAPIPAPVTSTVAPPPAPAMAPVPPAPAPVAAAPAPAPAPTTPLGVWATEENKGNVRIESCGANLCGYAEKTGERILINMRPQENKWVGRIHDPDGGSNYDSTIAMKGPNLLKVQGCAFGGMFCGGQTWKRVS